MKIYKQNGQLHREDGPAEVVNGKETEGEWFYRGEHHRLDGPALLSDAGNPLYRIMGKNFSEQEFPQGVARFLDSQKPVDLSGTETFADKKVILIGAFVNQKTHLQNTLLNAKANVVVTLSKNTDYAVVGARPGKKLDQAKALGVRILTEEQAIRIAA